MRRKTKPPSRQGRFAPRLRARDLGIPFDGVPGPLNAITDVAGVMVGHSTIIKGSRTKAVRTGVTAIIPGPQGLLPGYPAGWFSLNGAGEMTGTAWLDEAGILENPILLTNTNSVGVARDAILHWGVKHFRKLRVFTLPVAAETYDGILNDIDGFHVSTQHAVAAIETATGGAVAEGNVGGGTGMIAYEFKGGIGTSSRMFSVAKRKHFLGALVQANYGRRHQLRIAGVPIGKHLTDLMPSLPGGSPWKDGSIIVVIATDVPLLPHQLKRLARHVSLGLGRNGSVAMNTSGDIFIAFSTAVPKISPRAMEHWQAIPNGRMDSLFTATIEATEEAIINAMIAADTMTGFNGNTVHAIPHDRLQAVLRQYGRQVET